MLFLSMAFLSHGYAYPCILHFNSVRVLSCVATLDKCGDADDCISTSEAAKRESKPSDERLGICLCLAK